MALFGSLATLRAQAPRTPNFTAAFTHVEELLRTGSPARARLLSAAPGDTRKVELGGGMFALEQVYETKPRAEGFFESHRKYIDVQAVIEGDELMEVIDVAFVTLRQPYDSERDFIAYEDATAASLLRMDPGLAAIFFPVDVHMGSLRRNAAAVLVRKCVVKVPVL